MEVVHPPLKGPKSSVIVIKTGGEKPTPQLYAAPDPDEDPEAKRAMENLASLAAQVT
jgi:hypothetical protein